jgi:asparaginyl-tRNA synthetase
MTTNLNTVNKACVDETKLSNMSLYSLNLLYKAQSDLIANKTLQFNGWIRRVRVGGNGSLIFIDIYDGTMVGSLIGVVNSDTYIGTTENKTQYTTLEFSELSRSEYLSPGCSVLVSGLLVISPSNTTQDFELQIHSVQVIGNIDNPRTYPIQKANERRIASLRQLPFMRVRSQVSQCLLRIRSKLAFAVHRFMDSHNVQLTDPNIITKSDCEGAGETFSLTPLLFSHNPNDNNQVGLTVSSQLPLEALIHGFKQVYTCQKSFRAEKSDTPKHLAEFLHVEYEGAFINLNGLLNFTEDFVRDVISYVYNRCAEDFDWLESKFAPIDMLPTRKLLTNQLNHPFTRIKHREAIDLIVKIVKSKVKLPDDKGVLKRVKLKVLPKYDDDLGSEHEKLLVKYFGYMSHSEGKRNLWEQKGNVDVEVGAFVFVTHWPLKIKSFYMAQCDDDSGECESFDLLCPRVGEMFGGSMREWRYDRLLQEIKKRNMDTEPINWYLELRKMGSMPHGGWGMGFARLVMLLTGVPSVRDIVPFPVYYGHCPY